MEKVFFVRCSSYREQEVHEAVKLLLQSMDFSLPPGQRVFIKTNLLAQNKPEQHTITHYMLIDALCALLREKKCSIMIGDSLAYYQSGLTLKAFQTSGLDKTAAKYGAQLVALDRCPLVKVTDRVTALPQLYIPEVLLKADYIINACKLKTHGALRLTGAVKNLFGTLPGGYKQKIHMATCNDFKLSDVFLDLHTILAPCLNIMDAVMALDGGPSALGKPFPLQTILASRSAPALDVVACSMLGYAPGDIAFLLRARERGFLTSFTAIETIACGGEPLPRRVCKHLIKGPFEEYRKPDLFVTDTYVDPVVRKSRCTRCGKCKTFCPAGAITGPPGTVPVIDRTRCINCYYCLAACEAQAIGTSSSLLHKFIQVVRFITRL